MKIVFLALIIGAAILIVGVKIEKYFLTFRPYQPPTDELKSQGMKPAAGLYKILFWTLVLPLSYIKLGIEIFSDREAKQESQPNFHIVKPDSSDETLNKKVG